MEFSLKRALALAAVATMVSGHAGLDVLLAANDAQLKALLVSSPWCSFSYEGSSNGSGTTGSSRVVFAKNGIMTISEGRESYYSGDNGSYYGGDSGGEQAKWKVKGGQVMLSYDGVQWEALPMHISRNSNGYPIITANGTEYYQCQ